MLFKGRAGPRLAIASALLVAGLALSGCQFLEAGTPPGMDPTEQTNGEDAGAADNRSAANQGGGQLTPTPDTDPFDTDDPAAPATGSATVSVQPEQVATGNVTLALTINPAAPMYDPGRVTNDQAAEDGQRPASQPRGYAVLGDSALRITNNFDPAQTPPADQPREIVRHVAVQIRDQGSNQLVPHVDVSLDLLREGRSVLQDQPLVPLVQAGANVDEMRYGNNVKFPGRGEYQVFVRMGPSPLLGAAGVAQFNVSIK